MATEEKVPVFFISNVLSTLFLALIFLSATDMSGVYVVSDLGGSPKIAVFSLVFYGIGNCLSIPLANPLADRFGSIRVYVLFLLIFCIASLLCAIAPTFFVLNLFRVLMGFSTGFFFILARRVIWMLAGPKVRSLCNFLIILFYTVGPVIGACYGGLIAYNISWRVIFLVTIPIVLWIAGYLWFFYRDKFVEAKEIESFDWLGYIFFAFGVFSFVAASVMSQYLDWFTSNIFITLVIIGVISSICFYVRDVLHPNPLLELKLVGHPFLFYTFFSFTFLYSAYYGMTSLVLVWLKLFTTFDPRIVTVLLLIEASSALIAFFLNYYFMKKFDVRFTLLVGLTSMLISCYIGANLSVETDFFHVAITRVFSGFGIVFFLYALCVCSISSHDPSKSMKIYVQLQIIRTINTVLGVALYFLMWERREAFYYERLGEALTSDSPIFLNFLQRGQERFDLTYDRTLAKTHVYLQNAATSLGLNDVFGFMIYVIYGVMILLLLSFIIRRAPVKV